MSARVIKKELQPITFGAAVVSVSYEQAQGRQLFKFHAGMVRHFVDECESREEGRLMYDQLTKLARSLADRFSFSLKRD